MVVGYRVMRTLEAGALLLRRTGLAPLVDAARDRVLALGGPFESHIGPARLSGAGVPHLAYFRELRAGREGYMSELLAAAAAPGAVVVDAGAHLGYLTQLAAARGARVYAFEPNPETRELLERGLARSRLADRVTVVPQALAARTEQRRLYLSGGGDTSSLYEHGGARAVTVSCVRGDEFFAPDERLDVLKLDVEGGEVDALAGLRETLERSKAGLTVFAECNPDALTAAGHDAETLVAALRAHGLAVYVCDEAARALVPWSGPPASGYVNLIARSEPA
jgi:FkbM family methyltransferase